MVKGCGRLSHPSRQFPGPLPDDPVEGLAQGKSRRGAVVRAGRHWELGRAREQEHRLHWTGRHGVRRPRPAQSRPHRPACPGRGEDFTSSRHAQSGGDDIFLSALSHQAQATPTNSKGNGLSARRTRCRCLRRHRPRRPHPRPAPHLRFAAGLGRRITGNDRPPPWPHRDRNNPTLGTVQGTRLEVVRAPGLGFLHDPAQPVSVLQDLARNHPLGGTNVCAVPSVSSERRGPAARAWRRHLPREGALWWHRFGPLFASEIRKRRVEGMRSSHWRWHLDEVFVKINGERHYLWRAVDHEGEVLESLVTKTRDKKAALKFLKKSLKRHCRTEGVVTGRFALVALPSMNLASAIYRKPAAEPTIVRRIRTSRSESASGPCCVSGACERYESSPPFIPRSITISTRSAHYSRQNFKLNRAAALAEWRGLLAA